MNKVDKQQTSNKKDMIGNWSKFGLSDKLAETLVANNYP